MLFKCPQFTVLLYAECVLYAKLRIIKWRCHFYICMPNHLDCLRAALLFRKAIERKKYIRWRAKPFEEKYNCELTNLLSDEKAAGYSILGPICTRCCISPLLRAHHNYFHHHTHLLVRTLQEQAQT